LAKQLVIVRQGRSVTFDRDLARTSDIGINNRNERDLWLRGVFLRVEPAEVANPDDADA